MIYKFDGIDITRYGVLPVQGDGGVALSGMFDLPKRKGVTERNWGDRVEPFVAAGDIQLDDRTLGLKVVMTDTGNWANFRQACLDCRELDTEWGRFRVFAADEIRVEPAGNGMQLIDIGFRQPEVELPALTLKGSGGTGYRLDDYQLEKDFGIGVSEVKGDRDVPKRIEPATTAFYPQTVYRMPATITMECTMQAENLTAIAGRMGQLQALCMAPGLRTLYFADGRNRQVYVKEGFKVKVRGNRVVSFSLKMQAL